MWDGEIVDITRFDKCESKGIVAINRIDCEGCSTAKRMRLIVNSEMRYLLLSE